MDKFYGLTNKPNEGVRDKAPDWMNSLFEKQMSKTASTKSDNPFNGVDDKRLNPSLAGVKKEETKCELCGAKLKPTEVDVCEKCADEK